MERIGYQGRPGSNNHAAARYFASRYGWTESQLVPLVTGENLMAALNRGEVRFGVYAHSTAAGGIVAENEAAFGDRVRVLDQYAQQCIRYLVTGKHTKAAFNCRYGDIKELGYVSLVNCYHNHTRFPEKM